MAFARAAKVVGHAEGGSVILPELLTVDEAAELLRTTPNAVRIRIHRGDMPGVVRGGRRLLIRRDELRASVGLKGERDE